MTTEKQNDDGSDLQCVSFSQIETPGRTALSSASLNSSKSLELSTQRELLFPLELHTLDTVWHHLIPFIHNTLSKRIMEKTAVDNFIHFIYGKYNLCSLILSSLLYIIWILSGAYEFNQILTSAVYWWFIIEVTLLLYTANFRMFKDFLFNFTFWFKIISITVGVISRQLVFDGTDRFLASGWHFFSGISFIISYFVASQIVAGLKAYYWPIQLTILFLILISVLNIVQIWQIYESDFEFTIAFLGNTISLRNTAMSAYTNATLFYLKQLFMDTYYRNYVPQMVRLDWEVDETSYDIFYSGRYHSEKTISKSGDGNK